MSARGDQVRHAVLDWVSTYGYNVTPRFVAANFDVDDELAAALLLADLATDNLIRVSADNCYTVTAEGMAAVSRGGMSTSATTD